MFQECPSLSLTEINMNKLLILLLKSSQCSSTIQWQKKASRYNMVTMATKMDFHFSVKIGHFNGD